MATLERGTQDQHITVELSNRRLPMRMVAGRLRNNLRHPGDVPQARTHRNGRLAMIAVAVLAMPIVGLTRSIGKPRTSAR